MRSGTTAKSPEFSIFSDGPLGEAHVQAHRHLDAGELELGRTCLDERLQQRIGPESDWVHLQFHLALFDLELGDWEAAYSRFISEILPSATKTRSALTDAPSLLWRLDLCAPHDLEPHWTQLRKMALADLHDPRSPLTEAHDLLTLAGARDAEGLSQWLHSARRRGTRAGGFVDKLASAIYACLSGDHGLAASLMHHILPSFFGEIGGSSVQHKTFQLLASRCAHKSRHGVAPLELLAA